MNDDEDEQGNGGSCCGMSNQTLALLAIIGGSALIGAITTAAWYAWCPESPRYDRQFMKRQWWQRQRWHAMH
jgi:hypothetical protein